MFMIFWWAFGQHPVFDILREHHCAGHLAGLGGAHRCCEVIDQVCHVGIGRTLSAAGEQFAVGWATVDAIGVCETSGILQETRDGARIVGVHLSRGFAQLVLVMCSAVYDIGG